jgi:hypothetical protein
MLWCYTLTWTQDRDAQEITDLRCGRLGVALPGTPHSGGPCRVCQ